MAIATDLSEEALTEAMPRRPVRVYPALASTESDALAWAREGATEGSLVVADYQVSARGRAGWEWPVEPGRSLGFSLVLRPRLFAEREGWLFAVAVSGLADVLSDVAISWPDGVHRNGEQVGAINVSTELAGQGTDWAVVSVYVPDAEPPRTALLARIVERIAVRYRSRADEVLEDYRPRCATLGRTVTARLMGGGGAGLTGKAVDVFSDGALSLETPRGNRVAVRPQNLSLLEDAENAEDAEDAGDAEDEADGTDEP